MSTLKIKLSQKVLSQIYNCVIWGAIGDSIGCKYETGKQILDQTISLKNFNWNYTDDTQMTLATCEAIFTNKEINPEQIAKQFLNWYNNGKITHTGASTLKALIELQTGGHWAYVGRKGEFAAGNGAAMRIAPLAFFIEPENFKHKTLLRDICSITHNNDQAYTSALAIVIAINYVLTANKIRPRKFIEFIINRLPDCIVKDKLIKIQYKHSIQDAALEIGNSGYAPESVAFSIFCSTKIESINIFEIYHQIIQTGGDTDTNCSLTGHILGNFISNNRFDIQIPKGIYDSSLFSNIKNVFEVVKL